MSTNVLHSWGLEIFWSLTDQVSGRLLSIRSNHHLGLTDHESSHKRVHVLRGTVGLETERDGVWEVRNLSPGESADIPSDTAYCLFGVNDCLVIEVSTKVGVAIQDDTGNRPLPVDYPDCQAFTASRG